LVINFVDIHAHLLTFLSNKIMDAALISLKKTVSILSAVYEYNIQYHGNLTILDITCILSS